MAGTGRTNQNVLTIFFQLCHIATFHSRLGKIRKIYWTLTSGVPCFSHGLIQVPDRSGKATWRPTAIGFVMWQRMRWVQQLVSLRFSEFPWGHISTGNSSLELIFATCLSLTQNYTLVYTSINCESKCHFKSWPSCSWHLPVWYLLTRFSLQINIQMSAATISLQSQNLKNLSNLPDFTVRNRYSATCRATMCHLIAWSQDHNQIPKTIWQILVSELEVLWWASTNEVPVDVMEFLELWTRANSRIDDESWHVEVLLQTTDWGFW